MVVSLQLIRSGVGWRKTRSEDVAQSICSSYLVPEDGQALPAFKPGRFLTSCSEVGHEPNPQGHPRRLPDRHCHGGFRLSASDGWTGKTECELPQMLRAQAGVPRLAITMQCTVTPVMLGHC